MNSAQPLPVIPSETRLSLFTWKVETAFARPVAFRIVRSEISEEILLAALL